MLRKSLENTAVQIIGKAVMVIISLVTTGILTRKLGATGYGGFVLISSLFVFLDSLADFGTKTIGVREVSRSPEKDLMGHIFNLRMTMTTISFILGLLVVWGWDGLAHFRWEATVALMMIFLTSVGGFMEIIFQSRLRMELKVLMDITFPLTFLIGLWKWSGEITLLWVMTAYVVARAVSLMVGWWLVSGIEKVEFRKLNWTKVKTIWDSSWPMGLFLIIFATYDKAVDSLLIQHFLGPLEVAYYGLAYKIHGVMLQPAYYFVNSIFPILSNRESKTPGLMRTSLVILLVMVAGAMMVVWMLAPWMIYVLGGAEFAPSVGILRTLMWAMLFSYVGHLVGFALIADGGQKEMLKLGIVALVVNLSLNMLLIPRFGVLAAAWVTVFTEMVDMGMMIWFWKNRNRAQ
ncbi:flippase [Candidatus Shapirobacteria bacterium]|nr:flippase [Candidatus Shapirobacteria bacterium]